MPEFIPARELARRYYLEAVRPILDAGYPGLAHSSGLLGPGKGALTPDVGRSRLGAAWRSVCRSGPCPTGDELRAALGRAALYLSRLADQLWGVRRSGTVVPKLVASAINHRVR